MKIWIDTEFNSYKGALISMALVAEDGRQFYESLGCEQPDPWVAEHVMPIICRETVSIQEFQYQLQQFLMQFDRLELIADWPEDIAHFCQALITGPGTRLDTPPLTMRVVREDAPSKVPHNALWDAIGMRDANIGAKP